MWESFSQCDIGWNNWLNAQSVSTAWLERSGSDSTGIPYIGTLVEQLIQGNTVLTDSIYPNTASLNYQYDSTVTSADSTLFTIVCQSVNGGMYNVRTPFDSVTLNSITAYAFSGHHVNAAAAPIRQTSREAALYTAYTNSGHWSRLRTSRQFFARVRPGGYVAEGRELTMRVSDSLGTGMTTSIFDSWIASDSIGINLPMVSRTRRTPIDSLPQVRSLLRNLPIEMRQWA